MLADGNTLLAESGRWSEIFKRLNAVALSVWALILRENIQDSRDELNYLIHILTQNINIIDQLVKGQQMNDSEIPENIKHMFKVHINFDSFVFVDFKSEIENTKDADQLHEFFRRNFLEIYAGIDLADVILQFAKSRNVSLVNTPRKFNTKSSNHWSERSSHARGSNPNTFGRNDSWNARSKFGSEIKSPLENSSGVNSMTFKKKKEPQKDQFAHRNETLNEEDFPDVEDASMRTDSELEGFRENTRKLEALQPTSQPQKGFGEMLSTKREEQSPLASR